MEDKQDRAGAGQGDREAVERGRQEMGGLRVGPQKVQRVKNQGGETAAVDQGLGHGQGFLQIVGRANQQAREVQPAAMGIVGIKVQRLIHVAYLPACRLRLGQELERQGCLARGGGTHQLAYLAFGQAAGTQGAVECGESGGDVGHASCGYRFPLDQRLWAVAPVDGRYSHIQLAPSLAFPGHLSLLNEP